jgi:hypothetical protein
MTAELLVRPETSSTSSPQVVVTGSLQALITTVWETPSGFFSTGLYTHVPAGFEAKPRVQASGQRYRLFSTGLYTRVPASIANRLSYLESLQDDWDAYGARKPTALALQKARRLIGLFPLITGIRLLQLHPAATPYDVSPLPSGGVMIEWRGRAGILQLEVGPTGEFGYLLVTQGSSGREFTEGENISPSRVLELMTEVVLS